MKLVFYLLLFYSCCEFGFMNTALGVSQSAGQKQPSSDSVYRHNRMKYKMPTFRSPEEWNKRARYLRTHILVSTGLWHWDEKCPLEAEIETVIEHSDYQIEKVYFQSHPGYYVTGNLYRPRNKTGTFPAILCPHGHWQNGRLENSEKSSVPGRCINFAKQGYVVFSYDMVGYLDSKQITHEFANDKLSQLWGINLMGLQLWNSIRALDFLCSLDPVDTTRIACTGASGGGTQTFMLTAVDDRIDVAAPVNMISAQFQGGCLCENAPGLRLNTFNVEIAALFASKPLLMVSTSQDWTQNTPKVELPMMKGIYGLFDAKNHVQNEIKYFTTYNKTLTQNILQDIYIAYSLFENKKVYLVGLDHKASLWISLIMPMVSESGAVLADLEGIDLQEIFIPGLARYGGLETALILAVPTPILTGKINTELRDRIKKYYTLKEAEGHFRYDDSLHPKDIVHFLK